MQNLWERACSRKRFNIQHGCRLTHRFREQARSHKDVVLPCFQTKKNAPNQSGRFHVRLSGRELLAFPALQHEGGVGATEAEAVAHHGIDGGVFASLGQDWQVGHFWIQLVDVGGTCHEVAFLSLIHI